MGKLKQAPARLRMAPSRIGSAPVTEAERSRQRMISSPWRGWYKTARWKDLRWDVLEAARFTCDMCGRIEGNTALLVADHRTPHRGDPALFWARGNLQCLCKGCHDKDKQREERQHGRA